MHKGFYQDLWFEMDQIDPCEATLEVFQLKHNFWV